MQNHQRKTYVTQLHKVYNQAQQALLQYQTDKNAVDLNEAGLGNTASQVEFIKTYFKVIQDCGTDPSPCFSDNYKKLSGTSVTAGGAEHFFVLADGSAIATNAFSNNQTRNLVMEIWVDTNGAKGPNIVGRDFFIMYAYKNGVIDDINFEEQNGENNAIVNVPLEPDYRERMFNTYCKGSGGQLRGCFGKILNDNWEMTY